MRANTFFKTAGFIFGIIAVLHALRLINAWDAIIGNYIVPMWLSWVAVVVSGLLCISAFKLVKR